MLTLLYSTLSCSDEGDLIGVDHVMCSVFQQEFDS